MMFYAIFTSGKTTLCVLLKVFRPFNNSAFVFRAYESVSPLIRQLWGFLANALAMCAICMQRYIYIYIYNIYIYIYISLFQTQGGPYHNKLQKQTEKTLDSPESAT